MKLILTQEVNGLGSAGDVVEVKDGYGRNYLVPRGYGIQWSKGGEKEVQSIRRARKSRDIADLGSAREVRDQLSGLKVKLAARSGATGRLFGAVTTAEIAAAVKEAGGPQLDRRRIELTTPVKTLGHYQATVKLHADVSAKLAFQVVPG